MLLVNPDEEKNNIIMHRGTFFFPQTFKPWCENWGFFITWRRCQLFPALCFLILRLFVSYIYNSSLINWVMFVFQDSYLKYCISVWADKRKDWCVYLVCHKHEKIPVYKPEWQNHETWLNIGLSHLNQNHSEFVRLLWALSEHWVCTQDKHLFIRVPFAIQKQM